METLFNIRGLSGRCIFRMIHCLPAGIIAALGAGWALACLIMFSPIHARAADVPGVSEVVKRYQSQRDRLHTLKAVSRFTILHDNNGPVAPESAKEYVEYGFYDDLRRTRVIRTPLVEDSSRSSGEILELYADYSSGKLHKKTLYPNHGTFGELWRPPARDDHPISLECDLQPWLLLDFTPFINQDPRVRIEDLLKYSQVPPRVVRSKNGMVTLEVGWPTDTSIPSSQYAVGRISIEFDPHRDYSVVQVDKYYRYVTEDKPMKSILPLEWLQRLTVTKLILDEKSGFHMPVEVNAESFSVDTGGNLSLVYKESISVVDYQINTPLEENLGFRYPRITIIRLFGNADNSLPNQYGVYVSESDGITPSAVFDNLDAAVDYGRKLIGSDLAP